MTDNQPDSPQPPIAFCQNCGKPLDQTAIRKVGSAVYCEPCLADRIASTPPAPGDPARPYGGVFTGAPGTGQPPFSSSAPNPGLAALLGLIPGVGAMYNEQYAKGVVHLVIFALLVSFSHVTGIFVLFVFGWIAYMSIEAHHTAKARRDGTPLPNPFGLNDIGERMGFGSAWPHANPAAAARDAVNTAAEHINAAASSFHRPPIVTPPPAGSPWGAPVDTAAGHTAYSQTYSQPYTYTPPAPYAAPPYTGYTPVANPVPPYVPPVPPPSRFPTGAIWLICLGLFFLLGTMGLFNMLPGSSLVGVILVALGVWIFFRRMSETGYTLVDDGTPHYQLRLLRAVKSSVWLIFIGVLVLLDTFGVIHWTYSWPTLIILAGVMMIVRRSVYTSAAAAYQPEPIIPPAPAPAPDTTPNIQHEEER